MNYRKLFWGFIFLFDFRLGGFDILPDIIGFILIFIALNAMKEQNGHYRRSSVLALPLIFISIFDIYQNPSAEASLFGILIGLMVGVLSIVMVYGICMGIMEEAAKTGDADLGHKAMSRWKIYLVANIIVLAAIIIPVLGAVLFIPALILGIISYVLMLMLMKNAEDSLENEGVRIL